MSGDDPGQTQFLEEVFPEEIDYIAKRRMAMANGRPDVGTPTKLPHQPLEETPNAERNGLVGLAFSGGGIRSATFNLGVLQVLHKRRIFERVDLLSTVSGGGFIGSSLTSLMNRRNSFPFRDRGAVETDEVTHLRNNSNYLAPEGFLDYVRMFAVLLRGIILNFIVLVPILLALSLLATGCHGDRLLSRFEYDERAERTFAHLDAADLSDVGLVVENGRPVAPLLELLGRHGLVPFASRDAEAHRDNRVTDALSHRAGMPLRYREGTRYYRDIRTPLIAFTGSVSSYTFRDVTARQVARRLVDSRVVEPLYKIEEIQAVEEALTRADIELPERASDATEFLRDLTRSRIGFMPVEGRSDPRLFMVFVTQDTLRQVLEERRIIDKQGFARREVNEARQEGGEVGRQAGERPRYSLTQILQVFYRERLFDRRWLQAELVDSTSDGAVGYQWHDDEQNHLEVEAAAFELWKTYPSDDELLVRLFLEFESPKPGSLLKELSDRRRGALLKALQAAELIEPRPSLDGTSPPRDRFGQPQPGFKCVPLATCRFVRANLRHLPAVLYEQRVYDETWYDGIWRQREMKARIVPGDYRSYYTKSPTSEDRRQREIQVARRELGLRSEDSVARTLDRLSRLMAPQDRLETSDRRRSDKGGAPDRRTEERPLLTSTTDGHVLGALIESGLVVARGCGEGQRDNCYWVDGIDVVRRVPNELYDRELYNRAWFEQYFQEQPDHSVEYQRQRAAAVQDARAALDEERTQSRKRRRASQEVRVLFEWLETQPFAKPAAAYKLLWKDHLVRRGCPERYDIGTLGRCRSTHGSLEDALGSLYDVELIRHSGLAPPRPPLRTQVSDVVAQPRDWLSSALSWDPSVWDPSVWDPNRLKLPFTALVALLGLAFVLLFPLLLFSRVVPDRIRSRDLLERSFGFLILAIVGMAFFELQPYLIHRWHVLELSLSWSAIVAVASVVSAISAGPALSYFEKYGRTVPLLAVGILGPLLPFMIYLWVMDHVIYAENWPIAQMPIRSGYRVDLRFTVLYFGLAILATHVFVLFLNPNSTGMHNFYKDRLSRAYLVGTNRRSAAGGDARRPSLLGRLADSIALIVGRKPVDNDEPLIPTDDLVLSEMCRDGSTAPYHLVNVALNLQGSDDPNLRDRRSQSFVFSKLFFGGGRRTGYCSTRKLNQVGPRIDLGTAMAVSGAAAAPNMGVYTVGPLVTLLALLNIRLGYWVPNPRVVREWQDEDRPLGRRVADLFARAFGRYRIRPSPYLFLRELLGVVHDEGRSVNVSDGGHFENTAIYELLRRRCRIIIAGDAEADPEMNFKGLATLQRYARIDLGVEITIRTDKLRPRAAKDEPSKKNRESSRHFAVGTITYPEVTVPGTGSSDKKTIPGGTGYLLYLKSSLTGGENTVISEYARSHSEFPHESTADQFFGEGQFEAYRDLGRHVSESALDELDVSAPGPGDDVVALLESRLDQAAKTEEVPA